jgi:hypothetical protein
MQCFTAFVVRTRHVWCGDGEHTKQPERDGGAQRELKQRVHTCVTLTVVEQ